MAGKSYIKIGSNNWDRIKKMYVKTGGQTWTAIRKAYVKTNTGWRKVFDTASNRPFISGNDIPEIRLNTFRTNSTYNPAGTADDPVNPVVVAFPVQQMGPPTTTPTVGWPSGTVGNHLWGYDGTWVSGNGSAMTFSYSWLYNFSGNRNDNIEEFNATSSTGRTDMLTNSSTHLGQDGGDYFDKNFLTFRVTATNSAGNASAESSQVYIVRQKPTGTVNMINTSVDVPETLSANITYSNEWYRKTDVYDSKVEWFAIDAIGDPLTTSNRVAVQDLDEVVVTGTTTKSGTVFHNATIPNKIYAIRLTLNNSNTQAAVIPISGFIPNLPFTTEDYSTPGSPLTVTTLNILDYYNQKGTDNRDYIPVAGLFKIQSNVTGVDGSTTYRIRYRMYNWQNGSYYGMDGTNYGTAASSAWTTRTGSNSSFGFGGTLINNITVSGTTATLTHNESISSSSFGSTTYDGGQDRWQIEIEVSALKNSVRKYYADVVGGIPYYVSRAATSTLSASPSNAQVNQNVTLSGSFGGLGGGSSYPRQYRIYYGDGTDSGYLPIGEYSFGTANPSFSVIKQYTAAGEYFPYIITMPDYQTSSTSFVVSEVITAPTSLTATSNRGDGVLLNWNAVPGANYYEIYWQSIQGTGPVNQSGFADFGQDNSITTNSFLDTTISTGSTRYYRVRARISSTATGANSSDWFPGPTQNAIAGTRVQSLPGLPTSLTATTNRTDGVNLTFSGSSLATGYDIFWNSTISGRPTGANPDFYNKTSPFLDDTLGAGVTRYYWVRGYNTSGVSDWYPLSNGVTGTRVGSPPTGGSVSVNPTTGTAGLTTYTASTSGWSGTGTISYTYSWQRFTNGVFQYQELGTGTTFSPTVAQNSSALAWQVVVTASNGISPNGTASTSFTVNAPVSKLATPTGLSATTNRTDGINISWNAVSEAAYYGVWYRGGAPVYDSAPDFGGPSGLGGWNGSGTSFLDTSIGAGVTRSYDVQAFRSGNPTGTKSDWAGPVTGTRANIVTQYTISWNANGGSVSPGSNTVNSGTTVSAPTPTRSGYTFLYWRDSPSAFSYIYQINPGGSWTVTSNITFYAYWQQNTVAPSTPTGVTLTGSGAVSWNAVSGADYYEVLNYTDRTGSPTNTNNRLGPYNTISYSTSLQLGSSQGYSSPNNWARVQVRAWNNSGQVSTYSAWVPSSTTYT